jgi:hypothetical protein
MRTTKLGAVLATLAITTGTTAVLAAGPAQAATPTTTTFLGSPGGHQVTAVYRDSIALYGGVEDGTGTTVTAGDAVLQRKLPGKGWKNLATDSTPDSLSFGRAGSRAIGNMQYRVHYLGGTDGTTTWGASFSSVVSVRTLWNLHESGTCVGGCRFYGKLSPKAKNHRVTIQVKHRSWKTYKVVKTNRRSHWTAKVVATFGKGTLYRAVVGKTAHEVRTFSQIYRFYKVRVSRSAVSPR